MLFQAEILEQDVIVGWGKENENSTDEIIQKFYKAVRYWDFRIAES